MGEVTRQNLQQHAATLDLINAEIAASLARQYDAGASIDNKAAILVGYATAASSFLATRHTQPVLAGLAYACFALAAGFGLWAYAIRLYQDVPDPRQLFTEYLVSPKALALAAIAATRVQAFESNARLHASKAQRWQVSVGSLVVGVVLMLLSMTGAYW